MTRGGRSLQALISDFYNVVKFIKRLDRAEGDFLKEMEENEAVRFHVQQLACWVQSDALRSLALGVQVNVGAAETPVEVAGGMSAPFDENIHSSA